MSARYVWDKYNTKTIYTISESQMTSSLNAKTVLTATLCNDYELIGNGFAPKGNSYQIKEANAAGGGSYSIAPTSDYKYAIIHNVFFSSDQQSGYSALAERTNTTGYWWVDESSVFGIKGISLYQTKSQSTTSDKTYFNYFLTTETVAKGDTLQGQVSNATRSAYPDDGASGSNWYIYKGSDSIDPIGITYSTNRPERGKPITISVDPASGLTFGGTVSYQYQYSTDGGTAWTAAGSATADIEKTITVPQDAEQFMARVRAQDDMGFVSNDYVTGQNLKVISIKMWVGLDGKARQVKKIWVGVNGKAREVSNGWVGVDGKARRFS